MRADSESRVSDFMFFCFVRAKKYVLRQLDHGLYVFVIWGGCASGQLIGEFSDFGKLVGKTASCLLGKCVDDLPLVGP